MSRAPAWGGIQEDRPCLRGSGNTGNIAGSYVFGPVKLFGECSHINLKNEHVFQPIFTPSGDATVNSYLLGASAPIGPGQAVCHLRRLQ